MRFAVEMLGVLRALKGNLARVRVRCETPFDFCVAFSRSKVGACVRVLRRKADTPELKPRGRRGQLREGANSPTSDNFHVSVSGACVSLGLRLEELSII